MFWLLLSLFWHFFICLINKETQNTGSDFCWSQTLKELSYYPHFIDENIKLRNMGLSKFWKAEEKRLSKTICVYFENLWSSLYNISFRRHFLRQLLYESPICSGAGLSGHWVRPLPKEWQSVPRVNQQQGRHNFLLYIVIHTYILMKSNILENFRVANDFRFVPR